MRHSAYTLAPEMEAQETEFLAKIIAEARLRGPHLEIGTGAGGTLCLMMTAFSDNERPQFVVVDPMRYFPGQLEAVQLNLEFHGLARSTIDIRISTSKAAFYLAKDHGECFDFILIDGKHSLLNVMLDLRWARLLNCGGIVCLHDYANRFPGVQRAVNLFLRRNQDCYRVLGVTGSLIAIKKITPQTSSIEFHLRDWPHAWLQSAYGTIRVRAKRLARKSVSQLPWLADHLKRKTAAEELHTKHELHLKTERAHRILRSNPENNSQEYFNALINVGLQRHHHVVDFGCGSLQLGHHLIPFLDQGYYWGIDVTDKFFTIGLNLWYPDRTSLPSHARFDVLSSRVIEAVAKTTPDIVIVARAFQCVHPRRLGVIMAQLKVLCSPHTQLIVTLLEADQPMQLGRFSFRHTLESLTREAASVGLQTRKIRQGLEPKFLHQQQGTPASKSGNRGTLLLLTTSPEAVTLGALHFDSRRAEPMSPHSPLLPS